jgi:hypothetical protein
MPNVNLTYDEMDQAASYLTASKDGLTCRQNNLQSYISNLISSGFVTDSASVRFGEAYRDFVGCGALKVICRRG